MQCDLACISIERIQPFAGAHPKSSRPVFAALFDLVAPQAKGVVGIVAIADGLSGGGIESEQAAEG